MFFLVYLRHNNFITNKKDYGKSLKKKLIIQATTEYNKVKNTFPDKQSFILGYVLSEYGKLYETIKGFYMEDQLFDT